MLLGVHVDAKKSLSDGLPFDLISQAMLTYIDAAEFSVTNKTTPNVYKVAQNDFTRKIKDFDTLTKIALECGRFGQIKLLPKALKSCPKFYKLPKLVALLLMLRHRSKGWANDVKLLGHGKR